jgi:hypothetical protein
MKLIDSFVVFYRDILYRTGIYYLVSSWRDSLYANAACRIRSNNIHRVGTGIYSDSSLVVAFSDAGFGLAFSLARQMLSE